MSCFVSLNTFIFPTAFHMCFCLSLLSIADLRDLKVAQEGRIKVIIKPISYMRKKALC